MFYVNRVVFGGRMIDDPVIQSYGKEGKEFVKIVVAANKPSIQGRNRKYIPIFAEVCVFGKTGEFVQNNLRKGDDVLIDGELSYRSWKDKLGENRNGLNIIAISLTHVSNVKRGDPDAQNTEEASRQNRVDPNYGPDQEYDQEDVQF